MAYDWLNFCILYQGMFWFLVLVSLSCIWMSSCYSTKCGGKTLSSIYLSFAFVSYLTIFVNLFLDYSISLIIHLKKVLKLKKKKPHLYYINFIVLKSGGMGRLFLFWDCFGYSNSFSHANFRNSLLISYHPSLKKEPLVSMTGLTLKR